MSGRVLSTGFLAIVVGFFSFAVPSVGAEEEYDPFEKTNRKIFAFNDYLDRNFFCSSCQGV